VIHTFKCLIQQGWVTVVSDDALRVGQIRHAST
jgi:hypothetical protein